MSDCPCSVPPKHHAVILEIVYGLTDAREAPAPVGQPLTNAQAWSRHYKAADKAADSNCGRMLRNAGSPEALAYHRAEKEEASKTWGAEFRELTRVRARAKLTDYLDWGDPDPEALERLYQAIFEGVEDRDAPGDPGYSPYAGVPSPIPPGRKRATPQQIQRLMERCTDPRILPRSELTEEQKVGLHRYKRSRHGDVELQTTAEWASRQTAAIEGMNSVTVNLAQAEEIALAPLRRLLGDSLAGGPLLEALSAISDGTAAEWVRETASQLSGERFERLAESATGTAAEVAVCLVGVGRG